MSEIQSVLEDKIANAIKRLTFHQRKGNDAKIKQWLPKLKQLREVQAALGHDSAAVVVIKWTKVPSVTPIVVTLSDTRATLTAKLAKFERELRAAKFPELENGEYRYIQVLVAIISGIDEHDIKHLASLGTDNTPWATGSLLFLERIVKNRDALAPCKDFDELQQGEDQSVPSFTDEYRYYLDRIWHGAEGWEKEPIAQYFYLKKLVPTIRNIVVPDPRRQTLQPEGDFTPLSNLTAVVEVEVSSGSLFAGVKRARDLNDIDVPTGSPYKKPNRQKSGQPPATNAQASATIEGEAVVAVAEPKKTEACSRCSKKGHAATICQSEFHMSGTRIQGKPPGLPSTWAPSGKLCNKCNSSDHLSFFEGCPAQGSPAIRKITFNKQPCVLCGSTFHEGWLCPKNPSGPNATIPHVRALHSINEEGRIVDNSNPANPDVECSFCAGIHKANDNHLQWCKFNQNNNN
jgi:hypothetical protein